MHTLHALLAGLAAGLAVASQVGPVTLLLVETAATGGRRAGAAAGLGVATADLAFAAAAAATGAAAGRVLAAHHGQIRLAGAVVLAAVAVHGMVALWRHRGEPARSLAPTTRAHYARFLSLTAVNPLTIVSFAAVAGALSLRDVSTGVAFALGVGAGSAGWHLALSLAAGGVGARLTARVRIALGVAGRVAILAMACALATGAQGV
jgi:threonine/homoserine/homoserine lactone efflux protein